MRFRRLFPLSLLPLAACLSRGPETSPPGPTEWPEGEFRLRATVHYSRGAGSGQTTVTEEHWADLTIAPGGEMWMETSTGICRDPNPQEVERDLARGERRFQCGEAFFLLRPAGTTVRAELTFSFTQATRERGECIRRVRGACVEYGYSTRERQVSQRVSMRVERKGQEGSAPS